jgi:hypothetical protein
MNKRKKLKKKKRRRRRRKKALALDFLAPNATSPFLPQGLASQCLCFLVCT